MFQIRWCMFHLFCRLKLLLCIQLSLICYLLNLWFLRFWKNQMDLPLVLLVMTFVVCLPMSACWMCSMVQKTIALFSSLRCAIVEFFTYFLFFIFPVILFTFCIVMLSSQDKRCCCVDCNLMMDLPDHDPTICGLNAILNNAPEDTIVADSSQGSSSSAPRVDNKRKFDEDCFEVDEHGVPVVGKFGRVRQEWYYVICCMLFLLCSGFC